MGQSGLKFLADEHISPVLIRILNHLGERSIKRFINSFDQGAPDEEWIPQATERGFICLTYDRQMLKDDVIAPVLSQCNARVIFIGKHLANSRIWDQALWFLRYWPKIRDYAETLSPGQLVRIIKNGRIIPIIPRD